MFECVCLSLGEERNGEFADGECTSGDFLYHSTVCEL